jgi:hypothetical protein
MANAGQIDGRVIRRSMFILSPKLPLAAASSFASGIVRESLKDEKCIFSISTDPEMWVCSPKTLVSNLVTTKFITSRPFGQSSGPNGAEEILDVLESVGRQEAW